MTGTARHRSKGLHGGGVWFAPPVRASQAVRALVITAAWAGLLLVVSLYHDGLRDPRYLDGWVLAAGMGLQLTYHVAVKSARRSPKSIMRWKGLHVVLGYVLIAAFLSHTNFALPETGLEWALWIGFVLVTLSGVFGTYLSWSLKAKHGIDEGFSFERIPARRADLAQQAHLTVTRIETTSDAIALPSAPHDAWVLDLYATHLKDFFEGPGNRMAHLTGSQRALKKLTDEIDSLTRYVDAANQDKLAILRDLVCDKDRLDFARVYLWLTKGWLFVHVPVTYALAVLTVLHGVVVYAYSSGAW